mmetsp:Transcript_24101/g.37400  ORF Transcript_24101/g.37400 Transcript_24101/m.37400 type:complete len:81 (+) Transcript_24101:124-366(+)
MSIDSKEVRATSFLCHATRMYHIQHYFLADPTSRAAQITSEGREIFIGMITRTEQQHRNIISEHHHNMRTAVSVLSMISR